MFFLCLVALVKWPSLMSVALNQLRSTGLDPRMATPADWRNYMIQLLRLINSKPMSDELKRISPGRTAACYGMIWIAKRWGIIRRLIGQPADEAVVFELGCLQQKYELLPEDGAVAKMGEALLSVRSAQLAFPMPASSQASRAASSQAGRPASSSLPVDTLQPFLSDVACACSIICGNTSPLASANLAKRLLMVVEKMGGGEVWGACSMKLLVDLLPDRAGKALISSNCLARDARRKFGMSPLLIASQADMWGQLPQALRKAALNAPYVEINRAVEKAVEINRAAKVQPLDWAHFLV